MLKRVVLALLVIGGLGGSVLVYSGVTANSAAACTVDHTT
jgi:hypothetical protein